MKLIIQRNGTSVAQLSVDGGHFGYVLGHEALTDDHYKVILSHSASIGEVLPLVVGPNLRIHDGSLTGGLEVGTLCGDDFVLNGRAAVAKLVNKLDEAIDNMESITLEVE